VLDAIPVPIILQLPSHDSDDTPSFSKSEIIDLSSLPIIGVITGFPLDLRDLPKNVTWRVVDRELSQIETLLSYIDIPVIASLPGAFLDQIKFAVKRLDDLGIKQVSLRGGMYTLIKLQSRINSFLTIIHQYELEPLLHWDHWWIPSRSLHVNHFYGASWWQFGLHRMQFVRKKHYCYDSPKLFVKKGTQRISSDQLTIQAINNNYQFLVNRIYARNVKT
jgi:hypothetical protein